MTEDVKLYIPIKYRSREKKIQKCSPQEMLFVLNNLKRLTRGWERDIMESIIDMIEKGEDDLR